MRVVVCALLAAAASIHCASQVGDDGNGGGEDPSYLGVVLMESDGVHVRLDRRDEPCLCDFDYDVDEELGDRCVSFTGDEIDACVAECEAQRCVGDVTVLSAGAELGSASASVEDGFAHVSIAAETGDPLLIEVDGCEGPVEISTVVPPERSAASVGSGPGGGGVDVSWNPDGRADRACGIVEDVSGAHYCCSRDRSPIAIDEADSGGQPYDARVERFWDLGVWESGASRAQIWQREVDAE